MEKIIIAIDGYSGTGKSSTAKQVAKNLGYTYIDSGAMYRAVTYFLLQKNVVLSDANEIDKNLNDCSIKFENTSILLNDQNIDHEIRTMEVNKNVSLVSSVSIVRSRLVEQQRKLGSSQGVVMDGRDIGTVVFPEAELKVFMTANVDVRAERRRLELERKGINESVEVIKENLLKRDHIDSTRDDSPLKMADDAIEIDTSNLTLDQQIKKIVELAKAKIHEG